MDHCVWSVETGDETQTEFEARHEATVDELMVYFPEPPGLVVRTPDRALPLFPCNGDDRSTRYELGLGTLPTKEDLVNDGGRTGGWTPRGSVLPGPQTSSRDRVPDRGYQGRHRRVGRVDGRISRGWVPGGLRRGGAGRGGDRSSAPERGSVGRGSRVGAERGRRMEALRADPWITPAGFGMSEPRADREVGFSSMWTRSVQIREGASPSVVVSSFPPAGAAGGLHRLARI